MTPPALTLDMILVFAVIAVVVFLFVAEWVRVDVVAILAMVGLPMLGLIDGATAFAGLGSTAVVSIVAVVIMGRGLDHTGVIARMVRTLMRLAGSDRWRIMVLCSLVVALISSFMQNIGAAALFLPALRRISRETGMAMSSLLMPVGAAAILGGTVTLVGSSPLIMLNDLLAPYDLAPFGLFSVTPVGLALVGAGILYFLLLGRYVLPKAQTEPGAHAAQDPSQYYSRLGELYELILPKHAEHGPTVAELADRFRVHPVALIDHERRTKLFPPDRATTINPGAVVAVYGTGEHVTRAAKEYGFLARTELKAFAQMLGPEMAGIAEGVVQPHSKLIGLTLEEIRFRHNHLVTPLALYREDHDSYHNLDSHRLQAGDAILMHGSWENFAKLRQSRDLVFSHPVDHELLHPQKAGMALACFLLSTCLVLFTNLSLSVCLMTGAVSMVLTRVLTVDQAYRGVDWRTVFLLAGLIPLGLATQKSGAASWAAWYITHWLDNPPAIVLFFMLAVMSSVFTLVVSNVGATVLLVPLAVNLAFDAGADPRLAALVIGLAASNSFILPTHQVNALFMGPGGYRSRDFIRAGGPLSLIFLVVLTTVIYLFY